MGSGLSKTGNDEYVRTPDYESIVRAHVLDCRTLRPLARSSTHLGIGARYRHDISEA